MVSSHEQSHFANMSQDTPEDLLAERLVDQGVATVHDAYAQLLDLHPDRPIARDPQAAEAAKKRPHYSHRGGRSYPEPSDSELDPNWHVQPETLSESRVVTNQAAAEDIRAMLRRRREAGITDLTELHRERAIQRARDERRAQ